MYAEIERVRHEQFSKVKAERERAEEEHRPMPSFVDLDAADYNKWLSAEAIREQVLQPPEDEPAGPAHRRARHDAPPKLKKHDKDCDFDGELGMYVPSEAFRARYTAEDIASADRNLHVRPPTTASVVHWPVTTMMMPLLGLTQSALEHTPPL